MSDIEAEIEAPAAELPESAVTAVIEAISVPESVHVVNDVEVASAVGAAQKLSGDSIADAGRAVEHMVAQVTRENNAGTNYSAAENAQTESGYHAFVGSGTLDEVVAESHSIEAGAAAASADMAGAAAAAMERIATVQIAAQEIAERVEFAVKEVADRTAAGVQEEIKAVRAATEDAGAPAENLESALVAHAEVGSPGLKI